MMVCLERQRESDRGASSTHRETEAGKQSRYNNRDAVLYGVTYHGHVIYTC